MEDTVNDLGNPKRMRLVQLGTGFSKQMEELKVAIIKISKNAAPADYMRLRQIRLEFKEILQHEHTFSKLDEDVSYEIKKLLGKLKQTHPEICSKVEYKRTQEYKASQSNSQKPETTFDRTALEPSQDISRNVLSLFIPSPLPSLSQKPSEHVQQEKNMRKTSKQTPQPPVADFDDVVGCTEDLTEDETRAKIRQYKVWATELQYELEKRK